jgi:hypothetical protein
MDKELRENDYHGTARLSDASKYGGELKSQSDQQVKMGVLDEMMDMQRTIIERICGVGENLAKANGRLIDKFHELGLTFELNGSPDGPNKNEIIAEGKFPVMMSMFHRSLRELDDVDERFHQTRKLIEILESL